MCYCACTMENCLVCIVLCVMESYYVFVRKLRFLTKGKLLDGRFLFVGLKIRSPDDEIRPLFRVSSPFLRIIGPNSPCLGQNKA